MTTTPEQRPEGALIETARRRQTPRLSARAAAELAGISEGRWRQIVKGYQATAGVRLPVRAPADTLARMAQAVGLTSWELRAVERTDAAEWLERILGAAPDSPPLQGETINEGDSVILRIEMPGVPEHLRETALRLAKEAAEQAARAVAEVAATPEHTSG